MDEVRLFEEARRRYVQLANIRQTSWRSRQPIKDKLFVAPYKIADLLLLLADFARSAAREAGTFDRMFQPSHIQGALESGDLMLTEFGTQGQSPEVTGLFARRSRLIIR